MGDESLTGFSQQTDVQMSLRAASMAASEKNAVMIFSKNIITFFCEKLDLQKRGFWLELQKNLKLKVSLCPMVVLKQKFYFTLQESWLVFMLQSLAANFGSALT